MQQTDNATAVRGIMPIVGPSEITKRVSLQNDSGRMTDEKLAAALLALAAGLLKTRHPAVAAMVDYAIAEVIEDAD